jgi:hypothetical protein
MEHEPEAVGRQIGSAVPLKVDLSVDKSWRVAHVVGILGQSSRQDCLATLMYPAKRIH